MADVRRGLAIGGGPITTIEVDGVTYLVATETLERAGDGAGVHLLPAVTTPVAVRNAGINAAKDPWRPAFVLAADQLPLQLVLPSGMFCADRLIDVEGGPAKQYKLAQLVERGSDFERVAVA